MTTVRAEHTATLLAGPRCKKEPRPQYCGGVIVAGGAGKTAEIYLPATNQWKRTRNMVFAAQGLSATLLGDGRVLVLGGGRDGRSAQIYDPALNHWNRTRSPSRLGETSTATLITGKRCGKTCGNVLVTGSHAAGVPVRESPELTLGVSKVFDPRGGKNKSGRWRDLEAMNTLRSGHSATLVRGSEQQCGRNCGKVLIVGDGGGDRPDPKTAELFDPANETWVPTAAPLFPTSNHGAIQLQSRAVLIVGGHQENRPTSTAQIYDPRNESWRPTGAMASARSGSASLAPISAGGILAAGVNGNNAAEALATEIYNSREVDPTTDQLGKWRPGPSVPQPLLNSTLTGLDPSAGPATALLIGEPAASSSPGRAGNPAYLFKEWPGEEWPTLR